MTPGVLLDMAASTARHTSVDDPQPVAHQLTHQWIELDNTIRRSNELIRNVRSERDEVGDRLITLLRDQGYSRPSLRLGGETLTLTENSRKAPITLDSVRTAMTEAGVEDTMQEEVAEGLERGRIEGARISIGISRKRSRRSGGKTRRAAGRRMENQLVKQ
jgi:hypothetical protein